MTARRSPAPAMQVDLHIDDLVVAARVGEEDVVREAVETALRQALQDRLGGDALTTIAYPDARVRLDEPLATDPSGLGRQVAAEVTRVVLP